MTGISFNPTKAWQEVQRDIAQRKRPGEIADFICNMAPWAQSQHFVRILKRKAGLIPGLSLLDAGCATGQLGLSAAVYGGARVTLLDYSEEALNFAMMVAQELQSRGKNLTVTFVRGNLESLDLQEEFDIVTNEGVIEHWFTFEERLHVLGEMVKVTKPGGRVIVWVPNIHNPLYRRWIQGHAEVPERAFSIDELKTLFTAAGLRGVDIFPDRAYQSWVRFTFLSKVKVLGGMFWLLEQFLPKRMLKWYLLTFGYQLIAVGQKPVV